VHRHRLQVARRLSAVSCRGSLLAVLVVCVLPGVADGEATASRCDENTTTLDNLGWLANAQWHTVSPAAIDRLWVIDRTRAADRSDTCVTPNGCACLLSRRTPSVPSAWETFCFAGSNEQQRRLSRVFLYRVSQDLGTSRTCAAVLVRTLAGPEALGRAFEPSLGPEAEQEIVWRDRIGHRNTAHLRISRGAASTFVLRLVWERP
jgi:hypothetical protein